MSECKSRHPFSTAMLLLLFVLETTCSIATGIELILNDHYFYGWAVLGVVLLPMIIAIIGELLRGCVYSGCCGEASTSWIPLIFYHFYTAFMIVASDCLPKWKPEAEYLRFIHGFVQSAPQLLLQSIILLKGVHIHSLHDTIETVQVSLKSGEGFDSTISAISALTSDKPLRWYWGLIQIYCWVFCFLSILQTMIQFNEWSKRRHTLHRLILVVPFFAVTILYRVMALSLILVFAGGQFGMIPIIGLLLTQTVALNSLGLDMARSFVYGFICSLLGPSGYSRCREPESQPFGLSLMSRMTSRSSAPNTVTVTFTSGPYQGHHEVISLQGQDEYQGGDRTPEQVDMLRERSKNYLGLHVIVGGAILGISMAVLGLLIGFTILFDPLSDYTFLTYEQLNDYLYPSIGLVYLTSVLLTGLFSCCIGRCFEEEYIYPV